MRVLFFELWSGVKLDTIHKLSRPQVLDRSKTAKVDSWENHEAGELLGGESGFLAPRNQRII